MSPDKQTNEKPTLRPALIADKSSIEFNAEILRHILSGLSSKSISAALVCPQSCDVGNITNPGIDTIIHPAYNLPLMGSYNRKILLSNLIKFKPTVLHCLARANQRLTASLAKEMALPYIITVDSLADLSCTITDNCIGIIVPSEKMLSAIKAKHYKHKDKFRRINCATFIEDNCCCFKKSSGISSLVIAGSLDKYQQFEPVMNAIRHLAIDGYEFLLIIIGTGKAEQKIRKLIKALGLSHIVNIVPYIHPLRTVFSETDIYIHCVPGDRFSPYLLEAMSVGAAVVGCLGGADDLLIKDETAAVFDAADELNIYATIQQLLDKREKAKQLAANAQTNLRENYSVSKMVDSLLDMYKTASVIG